MEAEQQNGLTGASLNIQPAMWFGMVAVGRGCALSKPWEPGRVWVGNEGSPWLSWFLEAVCLKKLRTCQLTELKEAIRETFYQYVDHAIISFWQHGKLSPLVFWPWRPARAGGGSWWSSPSPWAHPAHPTYWWAFQFLVRVHLNDTLDSVPEIDDVKAFEK